MNELLVAEVVVRLNAIRALLPETPTISESYVAHFHDAIHLLENALGQNLERFGITSAELRSRRSEAAPEGHYDRELLIGKIGDTIEFIHSQTRSTPVGTCSESTTSRKT
jgi:hypothetical protein